MGKVINLGSGFEISIKDLASKICKILGIKMNLKHKKVRVRPKKSEGSQIISINEASKKNSTDGRLKLRELKV